MILNKRETKELYRSTARYYDPSLFAYRLVDVKRRRRQVVRALRLRPGETVVDMGCGTGLNFPLLEEAIGPGGRILGVDVTDAMLGKARKRVTRAGWQNIELVEADLTLYAFPPDMKAALATFALEMVPEYDRVIRRVAKALPRGGRLGLLGLKVPEHWPSWLLRIAIGLNKPLGASRDYASIRPWESLRRHLRVVDQQVFYLGAAYRAVGEKD